MNSQPVASLPATESIRIARPAPDERRIILFLTTEERKAALLAEARRRLAQLQPAKEDIPA